MYPPRLVARIGVRSFHGSAAARFKAHFDYAKWCTRPDALAEHLRARNVRDVDAHYCASVYARIRQWQTELNTLRARRNTLSRTANASARSDANAGAASVVDEARQVKRQVQHLEAALQQAKQELDALMERVPNDTHPGTPIGDENAARLVDEHRTPFPVLPFAARDHTDLGTQLGFFDIDTAARVSGHAHYYLLGRGALLELALVQYALSVCLAHGYHPVVTPDMVRERVVHACGFRPRIDDAGQIYRVHTHAAASTDAEEEAVCLAATAEIPLAGLVSEQTLGPAADRDAAHPRLPCDQHGTIRMVGLGHAYRAEAGARGRINRGIYRVHQFTKLELFVACAPERSDTQLDEIRSIQADILQGLGLAYRVLEMPTHELGAAAYRKYDIEAWMPGRGAWGELTSASNCTDYQARRLGIKYRAKPGADPVYAHTLNGTAMAVPRVIIALLEQGQQADGSVTLPAVLQPWMHGRGGSSNGDDTV